MAYCPLWSIGLKAAGQLDLPSPAGADQPGCYKSSASNTHLYVIWSTQESVCPVCEAITATENILSCLNVDFAGRIQPVDATHSLNISAGVWKPSVLRGLSFNCLAMALS